MNAFQSNVIREIATMCDDVGVEVLISDEEYNELFESSYYELSIHKLGLEALIYPNKANYWSDEGIDERFERVDYDSDQEMLDAVVSALRVDLVKLREEIIARRAEPTEGEGSAEGSGSQTGFDRRNSGD